MIVRRLLPLALLACLAGTAAAQRTPAQVYDRAWEAWERGAYPEALEGLIRVINAREPGIWFDSVALLTGELYRTRELAPDGTAPRWSPDGRHAAFEVGAGAERVTKLLSMTGTPRVVAELRGGGLVFAPDGRRAAYLAHGQTVQLAAARTELERATRENDRQAMLRQQAQVVRLQAQAARIVIRDLASGREQRVDDGGLLKASLAFSADGGTLFAIAARAADTTFTDVYAIRGMSAPVALTSGGAVRNNLVVVPGGRWLIHTVGGRNPFGAGPAFGAGAAPSGFAIVDAATGRGRVIEGGTAPAVAADGRTVAFLSRADGAHLLNVLDLDAPDAAPVVARRSNVPLASPALSPSGRRVAFQIMEMFDWEIHVIDRDGTGEFRVTREIQHDLLPRFLDERRLFAVMGEARHRRSYLYDVDTGERTRLFHNNTVRTIAPEYEWAVSPDATRILIVAERDGDTVSPERAVYEMNLSERVTQADLLARLQTELAAERALRAKGEAMYAPIAAAVRDRVSEVSIPRLYAYQKALFDFDSKHITRPGNAKARDYLAGRYRAFGYEPVLQEFEARPGGGQPIRTSNVLATLRGTVNPELIYVVAAHFDSRAEGPGADDNTSGTAVLLEAARVLAGHPMPATIVFASFTAEESGLLGSREFVRRALADDWKVVGALNNDMLGWTNDHRLDNTIRYSNPGIRDVQHGAAIQFSEMITYDALYYKSTDAAAFYEGWGDIVGGIGSYPVLGNPHYHQPHDVLEVENHRLIAEATRTTVATLMLLASSPSRIAGLTATRAGASAELRWTPSPERGIAHYEVVYGPASNPTQHRLTVTDPRARITGIAPGFEVAVRAVNDKGLVGWDWARVTVGR